MSGEKIDLSKIETITRKWYGSEHPVLALVRVARKLNSAEVRSDGE